MAVIARATLDNTVNVQLWQVECIVAVRVSVTLVTGVNRDSSVIRVIRRVAVAGRTTGDGCTPGRNDLRSDCISRQDRCAEWRYGRTVAPGGGTCAGVGADGMLGNVGRVTAGSYIDVAVKVSRAAIGAGYCTGMTINTGNRLIEGCGKKVSIVCAGGR